MNQFSSSDFSLLFFSTFECISTLDTASLKFQKICKNLKVVSKIKFNVMPNLWRKFKTYSKMLKRENYSDKYDGFSGNISL